MGKLEIANMTDMSSNAGKTEIGGSIAKVGQRRTNHRIQLICFRRRKEVRASKWESC